MSVALALSASPPVGHAGVLNDEEPDPPRTIYPDVNVGLGDTEFWEEWEDGELYHVYRSDNHRDFDLPTDEPTDYMVEFFLGSTYGPYDSLTFRPVEGNLLYGTTARITIKSMGMCAFCDRLDPPRVDYIYPMIESPARPVGPSFVFPGGPDGGTSTVEIPANLLPVWPGGAPHTAFEIYLDGNYRSPGNPHPRPNVVDIDWVELRLGPFNQRPVLMAHGWNSGPDMWADTAQFYKSEIQDFSDESIGIPHLNPAGSIAENASRIAAAVDDLKDATDLPQVNIIAHSKGGLDSRLYAFRYPENVRNLTMFATPNAGSGLADLLCGVQFASYFFNYLSASIVRLLLEIQASNHVCNSIDTAIFQLTTPYVALFNRFTPDAASVRYGTIAGSGDPGDWRTGIVGMVLGEPNDAAVAVASVQAMSPPNGRHTRLGTFPRSHETITEPRTPASYLALCAQYAARSCNDTAQAFQRDARASDLPRDREATAAGLRIPYGVMVDAGATVEIPIEMNPSEPAMLVVLGDVDATWGSMTLPEVDILGMSAGATVLEQPRDGILRITNATEISQPSVVVVSVETDRPLEVHTDRPVYSVGDRINISVGIDGVTGPLPASAAVADEDGVVVLRPPLTQTGDGRWTSVIELSEPGNYVLAVAVEGADSRIASTMFAVGSGSASFTGAFSEQVEDFNGNALHDRLVVSASVSAAVAGTYQVAARLESPSGVTVASAGGLVELFPGTQQVDLKFDGRAIFSSGESGPYRITDASVSTESMRYESIIELGDTAPYESDEFEHEQISLERGTFADRGIDDDGDGRYDRLVVTGSVSVTEAATYVVRARLTSLNGSAIASATTHVALDNGNNPFELSFPWSAIRLAGRDGPWLVRDVQVASIGATGASGHLIDAHRTLPHAASGGDSALPTFERLREITMDHAKAGGIVDRNDFVDSLLARLNEGEILLALGQRSGAASRLRTYVHRLTVAHPTLVTDESLTTLTEAAERLHATFGRSP